MVGALMKESISTCKYIVCPQVILFKSHRRCSLKGNAAIWKV